MIHPLICDDHAIVRQDLKTIPSDAPGVAVIVESADDPASVLAAYRHRAVKVRRHTAREGMK